MILNSSSKDIHEKTRKEFWMNVWNAVANSSTCTSKYTPGVWADEALKAFDERFPAPLEPVKSANE